MSDGIVFVSAAIFFVYMQRQGRWKGFIGAISGQYKVVQSGSSANPSSAVPSSSTPSTTTPSTTTPAAPAASTGQPGSSTVTI